MTVVFVAPDDSDDEDLSNCDVENNLKYKFITNETEHNRHSQPNNSSSSDIETIRRIKDLSMSNGNERKNALEQADGTDTASIDSNQRYLIKIFIFSFLSFGFLLFVFYRDGPSVIDRYLKHTRQYLPVKRTDSKE